MTSYLLQGDNSLVIRIALSETIKEASKALFISYEFVHNIIDSSVIVDTRPVFNDKKTEIVGSIIVPFLNIEFFDETKDVHAISIVLDEGDILKLVKNLEDAVKKISVLKEFYQGALGGQTFIVGEERFDDFI